MKNLTKSAFFYPLLLLLLALMAVAGLIITATYSDLTDYPVQSSAQKLDSFVEAEVFAHVSSNTKDPQRPESIGQESHRVATSAVAPSSLRTERSVSPIQPEDSDVEAARTESGHAVKGSSTTDPGALSSGGEPSAISEGVGFAVGATPESDLVIPVPPGEKVPALFLDEHPRPAPQQKMLDRMAAEFNEAVSKPPLGVSAEEAWEQARLNADEKYLKLFGYAAYNAYHLQAAKEAVRERQALQAAPPPEQ